MEQERASKHCPYCDEIIAVNAIKCKHCGEWLTEKPAGQQVEPQPVNTSAPQQVVVNQVEHKSNGVGTAGFVISLICAFFSWLPGVNFVLWFVGLLLSFIGLFKSPRGLAIVGFLISIIDIIIILVVLGAIGAVLS